MLKFNGFKYSGFKSLMIFKNKTDWLINEILEVTKSKKSINFYKKVIKELGEGRVEIELGELKHQIRLGKVEDPAKYFTTLLNRQLSQKEWEKQVPGKELATYKSPDQQQLFAELKLQDETDIDMTITSLDIIYDNELIKLPTVLSTDFFTLSTNKLKSDEVPIKIATHNGVLNATLIRGRIQRGAKEWGILSSFDGRVFLAVIHIWQQKGSKTTQEKSDSGDIHLCGVVRFSINELIQKVYPNIKKPGSKHKLDFINSLTNLCHTPYCIYCSEGNTEIYHGFELLYGPSLIGIKRGRQTEKTGITVMLSPEITRQYLKQRYLNRPEKLTKIKSEIGFLLWLYLEPRLESLRGKEYHAELKHLIKQLHLPQAKWHKRPAVRKQSFSEAIEELRDRKTGTGKTINIRIEKGLFDYVLIAKLT